jgi:organic radical activating enzyme
MSFLHKIGLKKNTFKRKAVCENDIKSRSDRNYKGFEKIINIWKPACGLQPIIVRWFLSEWCNYACQYCPQPHERLRITAEKEGKTYYAHAFDNYSRDMWLSAFKKLAENHRLSITITGGEPFLDQENIIPFLAKITLLETVENIRIDTNASWDPEPYKGIDKSKIFLMCTFHPSRVSEKVFIRKIEKLIYEGFNVAMVNFVITPENKRDYTRLKKTFKDLGVPLNANPLWGPGEQRTAEELEFLKGVANEFDLSYRAQLISPNGKLCLYPAIAYEINQFGQIMVGCYSKRTGDFIMGKIPKLFDTPIPCPSDKCLCLDKYSFLEGCERNLSLNPLLEFVKYIGN